MRVMVGLIRATSGSGRHHADLPNPGLEVGVLLDASVQHAGRTGREILTIAQRLMGLPVIAILAVAGEWSQRSGLTTFALVPHRSRVITAKAVACLVVAVVSIPVGGSHRPPVSKGRTDRSIPGSGHESALFHSLFLSVRP